jgi:hypothetical protein
MNLLEEYKDLYYKEVEFNDRLNNKITTCISFLTVLGSALILLWTQVKDYGLYWYTILYFIFCTVNTIMFFVCIFMFFKTYSGYDRPTFPIKDIATQNTRVLNSVAPEQRDKANKLLEQKMAERFVNDAINNRKLNITKSEKHYRLIRMIMATFIVTFITFAINVSIDYYESKFVQEDIHQIYIQGGEINVR